MERGENRERKEARSPVRISTIDCSVQQVLLPHLFMGDSYIVAAVDFEKLVHFSQGRSYAGG